MEQKRESAYIIAVMTAGTLWGFMGLFRRYLASFGITAGGIVLIRCGLAALLLLITLSVKSPSALKIRFRDLWCFVGTGLCSMLFFSYCYYQAMSYMSLSVAAILLYTAPIIVVVLSALLFREAFTGRKLIALVLAFLGCCLVSGIGSDDQVSVKGILYGLGSGFGYALYSIFARFALQRGYSSVSVTFYTCLFASLGAAAIWGVKEPLQKMVQSPESILWSIGTAVLTCYFAYLLYTYGLTGLETGKASICANIEPVVATIVGVVIFHEKLTLMSLLGITCVFCAVTLLSLPTKRKKSEQDAL